MHKLQKPLSQSMRILSGRELLRKMSHPQSEEEARKPVGLKERWNVIGVTQSLVDDFSFMCLDMPWGPLMALVLIVYSAVSVVFGGMFYMLARADQGSGRSMHFQGDWPQHMSTFESCIWYSVGNVVTVGFGGLLPASRLANVLSTIEHFVGIFLNSTLLGIVITKANMPISKIVFADVCIMTTRNGAPHLIVRLGNTRGNFLLNPEIRMNYMRVLQTTEGENVMKAMPIPFDNPPSMAPAFNIVHAITDDSPLFGKTVEDFLNEKGAIYVAIAATDNRSYQTLYARKWYNCEDIRWNHRFEDILVRKDGEHTVNFKNFNNTVPLDAFSHWWGLKPHKLARMNTDPPKQASIRDELYNNNEPDAECLLQDLMEDDPVDASNAAIPTSATSDAATNAVPLTASPPAGYQTTYSVVGLDMADASQPQSADTTRTRNHDGSVSSELFSPDSSQGFDKHNTQMGGSSPQSALTHRSQTMTAAAGARQLPTAAELAAAAKGAAVMNGRNYTFSGAPNKDSSKQQ